MIVQFMLMIQAGYLMANDHLLCSCGHRKFRHYQSDGMCDGDGDTCPCREFKMDISITTKAAEIVDPIGDMCVVNLTQRDSIKQVKMPSDGSPIKLESGLKDSGARLQFESGMVRDVDNDKPAFDLVIPQGIPYSDLMLTRWAELLRKGAIKYARRNWEKADSDEELDRAKASAFRHFMQWFSGETDEDHAAAVFFNINEVETIKWKQTNQKKEV